MAFRQLFRRISKSKVESGGKTRRSKKTNATPSSDQPIEKRPRRRPISSLIQFLRKKSKTQNKVSAGCTQDSPGAVQPVTGAPPSVLSPWERNGNSQLKAQDLKTDSTNAVKKVTPTSENTKCKQSEPAGDRDGASYCKQSNQLAIKSQTPIFVTLPGTPSHSEPLTLSASPTITRRCIAHPLAHVPMKTVTSRAHSITETCPTRCNGSVSDLTPHSQHIECTTRKSHHRSHGAHPCSKDGPIKCNTPLTVSKTMEHGNSFNGPQEVSSTFSSTGRKRKLTNSYSRIPRMLLSLSDPQLSVRELSRIKRYHTVDIDNDFIANFNYDFMNDNVI